LRKEESARRLAELDDDDLVEDDALFEHPMGNSVDEVDDDALVDAKPRVAAGHINRPPPGAMNTVNSTNNKHASAVASTAADDGNLGPEEEQSDTDDDDAPLDRRAGVRNRTRGGKGAGNSNNIKQTDSKPPLTTSGKSGGPGGREASTRAGRASRARNPAVSVPTPAVKVESDDPLSSLDRPADDDEDGDGDELILSDDDDIDVDGGGEDHEMEDVVVTVRAGAGVGKVSCHRIKYHEIIYASAFFIPRVVRVYKLSGRRQ
jgi:hypothetical protein